MQIELRDARRQRIGRIEIDPAMRPTRVPVHPRTGFRIRLRNRSRPQVNETLSDGIQTHSQSLIDDHHLGRDAFLDWEAALDDSGHLRRCVACGCHDLYKSKAFPQVTALVVVLAFAGAVIGVIGLATTPVLIAMTIVLMLDVGLLLFSKQRLVCYRCATSYHRLPIARYHRWWDRTIAERYLLPRDERAGVMSQPAVEPVAGGETGRDTGRQTGSEPPKLAHAPQPQSMFAD